MSLWGRGGAPRGRGAGAVGCKSVCRLVVNTTMVPSPSPCGPSAFPTQPRHQKCYGACFVLNTIAIGKHRQANEVCLLGSLGGYLAIVCFRKQMV